MAFTGNLKEFGIVSLLQLPNTNRLTGRLTVEGSEGSAEFFYSRGKLIHAACGEASGKEVLSCVIDWKEGEFSFESDIACYEKTVTGDLHHIIMWAVKERDERKKREAELREAEEAKRSGNPQNEETKIEPVVIPDSFLAKAAHASFACVVDSKGRLVAASESEGDYRESIKGYLKAVQSFIREYPQAPVGKTFIDAQSFSLGLCGDADGYTTVLFAAPNTRLGILSMELGKFMAELEKSGFGEKYEGR
ncbi:hypothetical protein CSA37_00975 [Candidatus Fermentibacteria bacterium]|nr:MAG: hypothetical protein CSA37_00975 [Candidatus Fermentibacteria bacterium]